ncbi:hypothetical protein BO82DRAFT_389705 [Aspergillus uvarum CBS 121591]|uniref:Peroxisomal biogenesis factor 11 n=1 Tax=Aspergillus uvarum CBS 121591 TaxID=1448315 RepID=A0A319DAT1_9EURO|nr:hypothetical protein BO82DRAFT_389705 [Aspergillus uvarum CBS 121591]PYH85128.1 hypothetical protein BO82DRAFT_389705 [Aspergillus uvarum CBS 121591]
MLDRLSRFYRLNTGYEKTLRLIQALCLVALEIGSLDSITTKRVSAAKAQLALTRRCIRFWNFLDCFNRVSGLLGQDAPNPRKNNHTTTTTSPTGFLWLLEVAKWSCFGVYFLLEDLTLLHVAEIYPVPWAKTVTVEAFKFWYYALALSLFGAFWEWCVGGAGSVAKGPKKGRRGGAGAGAGAGKVKGRAGAAASKSGEGWVDWVWVWGCVV